MQLHSTLRAASGGPKAVRHQADVMSLWEGSCACSDKNVELRNRDGVNPEWMRQADLQHSGDVEALGGDVEELVRQPPLSGLQLAPLSRAQIHARLRSPPQPCLSTPSDTL